MAHALQVPGSRARHGQEEIARAGAVLLVGESARVARRLRDLQAPARSAPLMPWLDARELGYLEVNRAAAGGLTSSSTKPIAIGLSWASAQRDGI
jgi:hypothetical protein